MTRPPNKRLGCGPGGEEAIKEHPFFASIDWEALEKKEVPAPEKPLVVCHCIFIAEAPRMGQATRKALGGLAVHRAPLLVHSAPLRHDCYISGQPDVGNVIIFHI
jgi:hypothetical protein